MLRGIFLLASSRCLAVQLQGRTVFARHVAFPAYWVIGAARGRSQIAPYRFPIKNACASASTRRELSNWNIPMASS